MRIGCALLAAGAGRRFGGGKLLYEVGGQPMIERALKLYASIPFDARVCVTRGEAEEIQSLARACGFIVAVNPDPERGVGTSVALATETLLTLDPMLDGILYAVSDQPFLTQDSVERLKAAFALDQNSIAALSFYGTRGNPAIFPRDLFTELSALGEDVGGGIIMQRHPERLRLVEADEAQELRDIDTREPQA